MKIFSNRSTLFALRALGPVTRVPTKEALRVGIGSFIGLLIASAPTLIVAEETWSSFYLIAPFGATSVLLFAAPNSPLAQPWPAIVGNTISAVIALIVCHFITDVLLFVPLSVGLAIVGMA